MSDGLHKTNPQPSQIPSFTRMPPDYDHTSSFPGCSLEEEKHTPVHQQAQLGDMRQSSFGRILGGKISAMEGDGWPTSPEDYELNEVIGN